MPRVDLIQARRDTSADWAAVNPILADGEQAIATDIRIVKFGDGVTPWLGLPVFGTSLMSGSVDVTGQISIEVPFTPWGIDADGDPYYDDTGAAPGEEAFVLFDDDGIAYLVLIGES